MSCILTITRSDSLAQAALQLLAPDRTGTGSTAEERAARRHLQRLSRLLLVEEACMEVDVRRCVAKLLICNNKEH